MAKNIPELRVEPIQKGGFLVHHSSPDSMAGSGPYKGPKKFAFQDHAAMIKHVTAATAPPTRPTNFRDAVEQVAKSGQLSPTSEG
jgi:hypothetical protein